MCERSLNVEAVLLPLLAATWYDSEALHSWTSVAGSLSSPSLLHSSGFLHSQDNFLRLKVMIKESVQPGFSLVKRRLYRLTLDRKTAESFQSN